jgi:hypothetical protein
MAKEVFLTASKPLWKGGKLMPDRTTRLLLALVAVLLCLNLLYNLFGSKVALAVRENENIGRYQISAWAASRDRGYTDSGYYVIDTATGQVIASKGEVHSGAE